MTKTDVHIGNNIRLIRRIKGMKQSVLADTLGITQQSVSKMEKKKNLTDEQIAEAAKVLQTTVEAIKDLNEERIIQNNFLNEQAGYINQKINPIEKIVELYERLLESKDNELRSLRDEISTLKTNSSDTN
ncbi:hypothetical protein HMPREF3127_06040, partial [Sphingobacterium sp. HMSC13C05]|uniref:helix-turn-helix domain-containing protein n=2 Tax=Sphingobacteriaceae TaxID=84566 RepID=UPI0008A21865